MSETYEVIGYDYKGEKDNPHGGKLHKFSVALQDGEGRKHLNVYWQRKSSEAPTGEVYGDIEDGEYGPRFRTAQRDGMATGGNFKAPSYQRVPDGPDPQAERSRRIERQHSQEMAIRVFAIHAAHEGVVDGVDWFSTIKDWTDRFQQDLDADVGGDGSSASVHSGGPVTADVSAGYTPVDPANAALVEEKKREEASPQLKGKLTQLANKAGVAREARKAIVMFRCGGETVTKAGAMQLVNDLQDGATHDQLIAEIWDAHNAGNNPLATRATKLLPETTPNAEPEPEVVAPNGEKDIPF